MLYFLIFHEANKSTALLNYLSVIQHLNNYNSCRSSKVPIETKYSIHIKIIRLASDSLVHLFIQIFFSTWYVWWKVKQKKKNLPSWLSVTFSLIITRLKSILYLCSTHFLSSVLCMQKLKMLSKSLCWWSLPIPNSFHISLSL